LPNISITGYFYKRWEAFNYTTSTEEVIIKINLLLLHLGIMCPCYILSKEVKFDSLSKSTFTNIFIITLYYHERSNNKQLFVILAHYPPTY